MKNDVSAVRDYYRSNWEVMLRMLLNWSEADIRIWMDKWNESFHESELISHESPSWYVALHLMPAALKQQLGPRANSLRAQLAIAIDKEVGHVAANASAEQWSNVRHRIEAILTDAIRCSPD